MTVPGVEGTSSKRLCKNIFLEQNSYTEDIDSADVVLANSHHWGDRLWKLFKLKRHNPSVITLHRVDGPISIVRSNPGQFVVDQSIMVFNEKIADGTIFQSIWSQDQCLALGMDASKPHVVIHNAPDPSIFYPPQKRTTAKFVWLPDRGQPMKEKVSTSIGILTNTWTSLAILLLLLEIALRNSATSNTSRRCLASH